MSDSVTQFTITHKFTPKVQFKANSAGEALQKNRLNGDFQASNQDFRFRLLNELNNLSIFSHN